MVKVTVMSAELWLLVGPECVGTVNASIVPPYIVRLRDTPAKACAPATVRPALVVDPACEAGSNGSLLNCSVSALPRPGHIEDTAPPPDAQSPGLSESS